MLDPYITGIQGVETAYDIMNLHMNLIKRYGSGIIKKKNICENMIISSLFCYLGPIDLCS